MEFSLYQPYVSEKIAAFVEKHPQVVHLQLYGLDNNPPPSNWILPNPTHVPRVKLTLHQHYSASQTLKLTFEGKDMELSTKQIRQLSYIMQIPQFQALSYYNEVPAKDILFKGDWRQINILCENENCWHFKTYSLWEFPCFIGTPSLLFIPRTFTALEKDYQLLDLPYLKICTSLTDLRLIDPDYLNLNNDLGVITFLTDKIADHIQDDHASNFLLTNEQRGVLEEYTPPPSITLADVIEDLQLTSVQLTGVAISSEVLYNLIYSKKPQTLLLDNVYFTDKTQILSDNEPLQLVLEVLTTTPLPIDIQKFTIVTEHGKLDILSLIPWKVWLPTYCQIV